MDTLEQKLLELLECPVCLEFMAPPIMQCVRGHNVCGGCKEKLTNCSICRENFIKTRSLGLEKIAGDLKYPCKYKPAGCELTFKPEQMAAHQAECEYGHKCLFSITWFKCEWRGSYKGMKTHVKIAHTEPGTGSVRETTGKYSSWLKEMSKNGKWCQIVIIQDELFLRYSKTTEDTLYCVVFYVGDEDKSKKFGYELSFTTTDGTKKVTTTNVTPSYCRGLENVFTEKDCAVVSYDFVKLCINTDNELPYEINIFQL